MEELKVNTFAGHGAMGASELPHPAESCPSFVVPSSPLPERGFHGYVKLTERAARGPLHAVKAPRREHVIATYYAGEHDVVWRSGGLRMASRTRPGTITLIPREHEGRMDVAGPIEISHVFLPQERLQASADLLTGGRSVELLTRIGFEDPEAARILDLLSREAAHSDPSSQLFMDQAIDLLCTQLVRGHSSFAAFSPPSPSKGLAAWQVKRVTSYMLDHLNEHVGLDELAALADLSRFYFVTAFKQATGATPHEWLVDRRMIRARELLAKPGSNVSEIALAVGYATPSAFTAAFRKVVGVTPTEFRRQL